MSSSLLPQKRPRGAVAAAAEKPKLSPLEQGVYEVIRGAGDTGIMGTDLKQKPAFSTLLPKDIEKALKSLNNKNLIKNVTSLKHKGRKIYMAADIEPSAAISGGDWYANGVLDSGLIEIYRNMCEICLYDNPTATEDEIFEYLNGSEALRGRTTMERVIDVLRVLECDGKIEKVTAYGEKRYRLRNTAEKNRFSFTDIPCGVCPVIADCTPGGKISPASCKYYQKWLEIDF